MVTDPSAELVLDARARTAESPVWDASAQRLRWVDIPAGVVHELDPDSGTDTSFAVDCPVGAVVRRERGGLLLALGDGFATCDTNGTDLTWLIHAPAVVDGVRMNDAACDPIGNVWAGTMHPQRRCQSALYRLDASSELSVVLEGVSLSNGLGWSPDAAVFYYVDTPTGRIDAFDIDLTRGMISQRRTFTPIERGRPDGLCVDAEGCVWVALWEGSAIQRFTPHGTLDRTIEFPVARVTSCAFGGSDLQTLFVTTARRGPQSSDSADEPYAGGVFAVSTRVTGLPTTAWAG